MHVAAPPACTCGFCSFSGPWEALPLPVRCTVRYGIINRTTSVVFWLTHLKPKPMLGTLAPDGRFVSLPLSAALKQSRTCDPNIWTLIGVDPEDRDRVPTLTLWIRTSADAKPEELDASVIARLQRAGVGVIRGESASYGSSSSSSLFDAERYACTALRSSMGRAAKRQRLLPSPPSRDGRATGSVPSHVPATREADLPPVEQPTTPGRRPPLDPESGCGSPMDEASPQKEAGPTAAPAAASAAASAPAPYLDAESVQRAYASLGGIEWRVSELLAKFPTWDNEMVWEMMCHGARPRLEVKGTEDQGWVDCVAFNPLTQEGVAVKISAVMLRRSYAALVKHWHRR